MYSEIENAQQLIKVVEKRKPVEKIKASAGFNWPIISTRLALVLMILSRTITQTAELCKIRHKNSKSIGCPVLALNACVVALFVHLSDTLLAIFCLQPFPCVLHVSTKLNQSADTGALIIFGSFNNFKHVLLYCSMLPCIPMITMFVIKYFTTHSWCLWYDS